MFPIVGLHVEGASFHSASLFRVGSNQSQKLFLPKEKELQFQPKSCFVGMLCALLTTTMAGKGIRMKRS